MSATAEMASVGQEVPRPGATSVGTGLRTLFSRRRLDRELASGADPNAVAARRQRALKLVGERSRQRLAASLESLLTEAGEPHSTARAFSTRVPIARAAIRDSRQSIETIVGWLQAPTHVSPQGVAMLSLLLTDGASPIYGGRTVPSGELRRALDRVVEALDHGPALAG